MSKIRVGLGFTLNMGNYETARYDFSVEDETHPDENTGQAFDRIYAFVEAKLKEKVMEDRREIAKSKNKSYGQATASGSD